MSRRPVPTLPVFIFLARIDGSAMEYEENVAWTRRLAARAHGAGAAVEAELGKLSGEEDGLSVPEVEAKMTDPDQVPRFDTPSPPTRSWFSAEF